jgi:alpha-beta hydrolase superfamily lysophospholipase
MTPDEAAPPLGLLLREAGAFASMRVKASFASAVPTANIGDGRKVIVIPGFLASDRTTARLRKSLNIAGYCAVGWGLGRNFGVKTHTLSKLDARIERMGLTEPVTIIGWSLGGLIAREYAKYAPHRVAKVVTLGSPFSGNPRANNAWRLYELVAGHKVDAPPIDTVLAEKPPVPTTAFWSRQDGVVAPASARGAMGEVDKDIELLCTHMAFVADKIAIRAIIAALGRSS